MILIVAKAPIAGYNLAVAEKHLVPAEEASVEIRVSNSRFIATIAPAFTVQEARDLIIKLKERFSDASHNVPAFVIGHDAAVTSHCSDDGEPSGTAGKPALAVLQGSGLGDAVVVVTRYFGGTKLGKGGLVRAYGDAVREVLDIVPLAEKAATHTVRFAVPYNLLERAYLLIEEYRGELQDREFAADVTLTAMFRMDDYEALSAAVEEMSHGRIQGEIIRYDPNTLMAAAPDQ